MAHITLDNFSAEERALIEQLDLDRLPRHVAMIMDGNGRWANRQGLPRVIGHHAGTESIRDLVRGFQDIGIGYLTLYSFSTENWGRPGEEVHALMELIEEQMRIEMDALHQRNVRIRHIGRMAGLPDSLQRTLSEAVERTRNNTSLTLAFAINYSGRAELLDAAKRLAEAAVAGDIQPDYLQEHDLARALYAPDLPDPELLIRTAGELRVSNFLLWQIAYAEIWVTATLWPEFRTVHLLTALRDYQLRQRKFGRVSSDAT